MSNVVRPKGLGMVAYIAIALVIVFVIELLIPPLRGHGFILSLIVSSVMISIYRSKNEAGK